MTKSSTPGVEATEPTAAPEASFAMTLEEFCMRKSGAGASVEMLAGFFADERAAGSIKATEAEYEVRFGDFATRPA